jgi:filamentous hemagglutinin family protein
MRIFITRFLKGRECAALALGAAGVWSAAIAAGPVLPMPCAPGACGTTGASQFITGGSVNAVYTKNSLAINQTTNSAILNWSSFDIGAGGSVVFRQPTATSIALNRIFQTSPSEIFGKMSANGQVYLINLNGFLFGSTATVNVGSLLVSSLPLALTDANFNNGILSPLQESKPVLDATLDPLAPGAGRASVLDINGKPVLDANGNPIPVQIVVEPGAQLTAADQGRLLLAGQNVINGGTLTAPDGQVILAAGSQVFLQADSDPSVRGLIVEVDADNHNTAWNQLTGSLSAPRGNITMVGLAVNQDGRISATTSVSANGSIRLEAADQATFGEVNNSVSVASSQGGTLMIGPESQMQILPELSSSDTAVPAQTQYPSSITLLGEQVILKGGSIVAPGGNLTAIAAADPSPAAANPTQGVGIDGDSSARLRIDAGTSIDLAGSDATLPVTANLVTAQLRASELADDPTQRNGALHGLTVYFDARDPPPATLANLSGEIAAVPDSIAQRTEAGGHAIFQSEGDIVFAQGASLNVSGGSTTYTGGVMQTSYLVGANGQLYPIATANPLLSYVGVVNPTFTQTYNTWGVQSIVPTPGLSTYEPGYVQGAAAGSVQFAAPTLVLQGALQGSAVNGLYQRTPATAVPGASLIIGLPEGVAPTSSPTPPIDYLASAIRLVMTPTPVVVADDASLPEPQTLELPIAYLTSSGFTSTQIYSSYGVTLPSGLPLTLVPGSTFSVTAARVDLLSSITDPAGTLSFQNTNTIGSGASLPRQGIFVGDGVTLDVSGLWTNDALPLNAVALSQTWLNAGSINLSLASNVDALSPVSGALLSLGNDVVLRANGGAWLNVKGSLTPGQGGSISLNADVIGGGLDVGSNLAVDAFGVNGAAGGTFNLAAPRLEISNGQGSWTEAQQVDDTLAPGGVFQIYSSLFSDHGFQNINLNASGLVVSNAPTTNVLTVDPGTVIAATVSSLVPDPNFSLHPSATSLDGLATVSLLSEYLRPAANVTLTALPPSTSTGNSPLGTTNAGDIVIGAGASVTTDAGGSIALTGLDSLIVDGSLRAPGGTITLHVDTPGAAYESGFLPNQRIELAGSGAIDVSGTLVSTPSTAGLDLGTVYAGGTVNLLADRGAVDIDAGSLISVAGVSAALDLAQPNGTYAHEIAATAGGSITVHSGEAISLLGTIEAAAGAGGNSGPPAAGSLDVVLSRSEGYWGVNSENANNTFNQAPMTVVLEPTVPSSVPLSAANSNQALLGALQLSQSGIDSLRIEAGNILEFSGAFSVALARQLVIDSPVLAANTGARALLSAPYLEVGFEPIPTGPNSNAASGGSGTLSFSGAEIDLVGQTVFQGASEVSFASSGDLVLRGEAIGSGLSTLAGSLTVIGNLTLDAARIYPVTATSFSIDAQENPATGIPGSVTIGQTGADPGTPYSAGGALSISAYAVNSTGSLYAPFGTISLNATNDLTLGNGSITSVSGDGLIIPYGQTQYGAEQWFFAFSGNPVVTAVPARAVNLSAPTVTIAKQATLDLTGGGDLAAYEWVPGSGGTSDALAAGFKNGVYSNLYAILPSTRDQASPQDPQNTDGSIGAGETVYLSGGDGLAAGFYPLLPARYALVPGAFLIEAEPKFQSTGSGSLGALADGTPVMAGYLSYGTTGLHQMPGYTGFAIYPGSYGSALAEYDLSLASSFFSAAAEQAGNPRPTLPADAGSLSISVVNALDAAGHVLTGAASGGLASLISISANDLVVGIPTGPVAADAVTISGAVLSSWQPGSLLLGGALTAEGTATETSATGAMTTASTSTINVLANSVTIGAGAALTAGQITLVANQSVDVQNGASLQSTSAAAGTASATPPAMQSITLSGGSNPALLAVSDLNWLIPVRAGGASSAGAGTVAVDAGASIASRGSLTLDGLGGVTLNGALKGPGAEWSLGSSSIAFVPAGATADALSINPALIAQLDAAGAVRLASTGPIDLMIPVTLGIGDSGKPTLESLTLAAATINNLTGANDAAGATATQFGAHTLTLEGAGASTTAAVAGPAGATLTLSAGELDMGPNALAVNGFGSIRAAVSGAVIGQGTGSLNVGGALTIAAAEVTAATAADTQINAGGALSILQDATSSGGKLPLLLAGALSLSGGSVDIAGTVTASSGILALSADSGDLSIASTATVSTAGSLVNVGNQSVGAPGGTIAVHAAGNLTVDSGANLDVSGAGTADAGALSFSAGQAVRLGSEFKLSGSGGSAAIGGSFTLDAGSLAISGSGANALSELAGALGAGGFSNAIDLHVRTGNLDLAAGTSLSANSVTLTADTGQIVVGGDISAPSGALRGSLSIFGGSGVEVLAGAALHADGAGAAGLGGTIEIGAGQLVVDKTGMLDTYNGASIALDAGSTISAAGAADDGTLLLRAPALLASDYIGIHSLAADTSGVGQIIVEPVLVFNTANAAVFSSATAPSGADFQNVNQLVGNYMGTAASNIASGLARTGGTPLVVEAGVEIVAPGTLTLQSADGISPALDLASWRFNGEPVDLTVRAAGSLTVLNTIQDGFGSMTFGGLTQPVLLSGPSSSIRLVAGADLSSADPLAVISGGTGLDITLGSSAQNALVRTGTGTIDLVAANDIVIASAGSGAYTAGVPFVESGATATDNYPGIPPAFGKGNLYGVVVPKSSGVLMSFPTDGGNLLVSAGGDIIGAPLLTPAVPAWQVREGGALTLSGVPIPAEWGVNLAAYNWNFGTLGGGDVRISGGRDLLNVTVAAADSLLPPQGATPQYVTSGGLSLTAGGDIGSAEVFLADGTGSVVAGGALTAVLPSLNAGDPNVGSVFYLQTSAINVSARLGIAVDGVFNPTALGQFAASNTSIAPDLTGSFFSYGADSALYLTSVTGDIVLGNATASTETVLGQASFGALGNIALGASGDVVPPTFSLAALSGNITFGPGIGPAALYPSPTGQLDLLAAQNITGGNVMMSDAAPGSYATVATPLGQTQVESAGFVADLHVSDPLPALVTAGGDIAELSLSLPKAATVVAGQDIVDLSYLGQNLNATDQTVLMAGRDFVYQQSYNGLGVDLGGPGALDILAGRNITLGFSHGVITSGNLLNANLPTAQGADLTMVTGLGTNPDFAGFVSTVIAPAPTYQAALVSFVELLQGSAGLSFAAAEAAFQALTPEQQRPLIDAVFFNELSISGIADNTVPGAGFTEGYKAIDALFPGSRSGSTGAVAGSYAGNLTLDFSQIYTQSGGDITLMVPGGLVDVGLAIAPPQLSTRLPSQLGIVAEGPGNVNIYAKGDVNVNTSRIFTLGGGNILIWSDEGSIDAGRGAKSSVSAPPPSVLINSDGTVTLNFSGAADGSGIRTIQTEPTTPPGNVDLIAPVGTVNAGDAGIGSAGNINIAARSVLGVANINFGGTATGVPATVSNVSASLSGASNAASGTSNASTSAVESNAAEKESAAPLAQNALSWLDVFVIGLGEENCKPDDIECLKRQKTPTR